MKMSHVFKTQGLMIRIVRDNLLASFLGANIRFGWTFLIPNGFECDTDVVQFVGLLFASSLGCSKNMWLRLKKWCQNGTVVNGTKA